MLVKGAPGVISFHHHSCQPGTGKWFLDCCCCCRCCFVLKCVQDVVRSKTIIVAIQQDYKPCNYKTRPHSGPHTKIIGYIVIWLKGGGELSGHVIHSLEYPAEKYIHSWSQYIYLDIVKKSIWWRHDVETARAVPALCVGTLSVPLAKRAFMFF